MNKEKFELKDDVVIFSNLITHHFDGKVQELKRKWGLQTLSLRPDNKVRNVSEWFFSGINSLDKERIAQKIFPQIEKDSQKKLEEEMVNREMITKVDFALKFNLRHKVPSFSFDSSFICTSSLSETQRQERLSIFSMDKSLSSEDILIQYKLEKMFSEKSELNVYEKDKFNQMVREILTRDEHNLQEKITSEFEKDFNKLKSEIVEYLVSLAERKKGL